MPVASVVHLIALATIAVAVVYRATTWREDNKAPAGRALSLTMVNLFALYLLGWAPFYWLAYDLLGRVPSLPQVIQHIVWMAMSFYAHIFVIRVSTPAGHLRRRLRFGRILFGVALPLLLIGYVIGPLRIGLPIVGPSGTHDPGVLVYDLIWEAHNIIVLVDILLVRWRGMTIESTYLRIGVRFMGVGCLIWLLMLIHKVVYQTIVGLGHDLPYEENGVHGIQFLFSAPGVCFLVIGMTIPSWGPRVARNWRRRRAYRHLTPLWDALAPTRTAVPVPAPRSRHSRLRHRVIGIRDALVGPLRDHLDENTIRLAKGEAMRSGLTEDDAQAVGEAALIAAAVSAHSSGRSAGIPATQTPQLRREEDFDAETAWLVKVSQAYSRSSIVPAVLRRESSPQMNPTGGGE
ncbi:MAB_1171c family putative transporter [Amycolatopsis pittospori]|uniref:MAB_1171c family putative transporter n=1 Tax=Amycolatopsis pittospori TaxID=2749434 RepID=UPI0015F0ED79|nr:MAB_1171c family putative transporter [Amycolatopsis pittospori]